MKPLEMNSDSSDQKSSEKEKKPRRPKLLPDRTRDSKDNLKTYPRSSSHDENSSSGNTSKKQVNISDMLAESPLLSRHLMSDFIDIEKDVMLKEKMIEMGQNPNQLDRSSMRKVLIKNLLSYQNIGDMANQLAKDKILLSGLSLPKYRGLLNNYSSQSTLHLPADFTYNSDPKPKEAFLSFEDIGTVNSSIIGFLEESLIKSQNNWKKFCHTLFSAEKNEKEKPLSNRILYSDKELTQIELEHNREQLHQIQKILQVRQKMSYEDSIMRIKSRNPANMKMPPIKVLPSRKDLYHPQNNFAKYERQEVDTVGNVSERNKRNSSDIRARKKSAGGSLEQLKRVGGSDSPANRRLKLEKKTAPVPVEVEPIIEKMSVFWFRHESPSWRPELRESTAFTHFGKYGFMFGGLGKEIYDDLQVFDLVEVIIDHEKKKNMNYLYVDKERDELLSSGDKLSWEKIQTEGEKGELGRYGHSVNHYNKNLIVFGGERSFNNQIKQRTCMSDLKILNLDTQVWKTIRPLGEYIEPRRNHTATIVGKHMIIKGGLNSKGTFLDDVWILDLGQFKWSSPVHDNYERIPTAFHSACNVYHPSHMKQTLYQENTGKTGELNSALKCEGIYFFGGKSDKGVVLDSMTVLRTDRRPMQWLKPTTFGKGPGARYGHSMVYQLALAILIVFGGKDASNSELPGDLFVLNLANLSWMKVEAYGSDPAPRSMHICWPSETKIIITGGCSLRGLLNYDCFVCEMHKGFVQRFLKEDHQRRNHLVAGILPEKLMEIGIEKEKRRERAKNFDYTNFSITDARFLMNKLKQEESEKAKMKELIESLSFKKLVTYVPLPKHRKNSKSEPPTRSSIMNPELAQKLHKETENLVKGEAERDIEKDQHQGRGKLARGAKQVILMNRFISLSKDEIRRRDSSAG